MAAIKKILVPVDGSVQGCKATDEAIFLAQKCNAKLDFVYVASEINKDIPSHLVFDRIWTKLPKNMEAAKRRLYNGRNRRKLVSYGKSLKVRQKWLRLRRKAIGSKLLSIR